MKFILFSVSFMFFLGVLGVLLKRKHLLTVLLCLELLLISLFVKFSVVVGLYRKFSFCSSSLVLLTFSACEAGVGLSLLVRVSRSCGRDNIFSLNLLRL